MLVCHEHRNDRKSRTSPEIQRQVHNETTKSTATNLKRSEAIIPHEPESASKFSKMSDQEQHEHSLFYDASCCNMVSRYAAIKINWKKRI